MIVGNTIRDRRYGSQTLRSTDSVLTCWFATDPVMFFHSFLNILFWCCMILRFWYTIVSNNNTTSFMWIPSFSYRGYLFFSRRVLRIEKNSLFFCYIIIINDNKMNLGLYESFIVITEIVVFFLYILLIFSFIRLKLIHKREYFFLINGCFWIFKKGNQCIIIFIFFFFIYTYMFMIVNLFNDNKKIGQSSI